MVPRDPALLFRPPAPGRAGMPQPGPARPYGRPGDAVRRPAAPVRPPSGPAPGFGAPAPWMGPPPYRPAGPAASPRRGVIIPRPAPPRRHPVLWSCVLIVLIAAAAAAAYYAMTNAHGRAIADDVWTYVVAHWRLLLPIGIVGGLSWGVWGVRKLLSALYRPTVNDFRTTTSVVVPSFREDPDVLELALDTWLGQDPDQVIVVLDLADTEAQRRLLARNDPRLRVIMFKHAGKRSALGVGIRAARGEILVLTDSDTRWTDGLLASVQMPFADPEVGGVSTRQSVYQADTSVWRRVAEWIINNRYLDYVPATGRAGAVVCVSGRTAAYRREIVLKVLPHLEDEFFFGRRCIAGDDGRLTWLVLASGYRTVYQSTAHALSMFPTTFRAFCKQRVRWSRNSYRCYLTAMWKGWLWRVPIISQLTVFQILLTPVTMAATVFYLTMAALVQDASGAFAFALVWFFLSRALRNVAHLRTRPSDVLLLPLVALVITFVALPIKFYAFLTMNKQGWLTRNANQIGGDGQNAASLRQGQSNVAG
jgi:cellulose synthase/poly-beta-1,6-N-acetylglucosamine synthase-like glycosyltransferase